MAISSGNMVAATAVWAITWVRAAVMTKQPSMIMRGPLTDDGEHLVGDPPGQAGLGEHHADDHRAEDEQDRRIHEILEGHRRFADEKQGLQGADQAGW